MKRTIINLTRTEIVRLIDVLGSEPEDHGLWEKLHRAYMRTATDEQLKWNDLRK